VVPFNQNLKSQTRPSSHDLMHDPKGRAAVLAWLYEGIRAWLVAASRFGFHAGGPSDGGLLGQDMNPYEQSPPMSG